MKEWRALPEDLRQELALLARLWEEARDGGPLPEAFSQAMDRLTRWVMDSLEGEDPALRAALGEALSQESVPLSKEELRALILDPEP